jgi:hypothetical protein
MPGTSSSAYAVPITSHFPVRVRRNLLPVAEAGGMGFVPVPGSFDDGPKVGVVGRPAEFASDPLRIGDEYRWVARPARRFLDGD